MRTVLLVMVTLFSATLCAVGQEIDHRDPLAVTKAYVEACQSNDMEAAARLVLNEGEAQGLQEMAKHLGPGVIAQTLSELFCLPLAGARYEVGQIASAGGEAQVQVEATYALPLKLVLRKGDDGNWRVAVRESVQNTTGAEEPTLLRGGRLFGDAGMRVQEACQANLKQLMLAVLMYAQDHDEVLPSAETWRDDIMPYIGNVQVFQCFVNPWGYTYNASLSKKPLAQIDRPSETISLFEVGHMEPNAAADLTKVQMAHRHNGGDNVAYVDGHGKWLPGQ